MMRFEETKGPSTDPLVTARLRDNVVVIEKDLESLIKDEVKELNDSFAQNTARLKSQFLGPNFNFTEKGTRGELEISTKGRRVTVEWNLTDVPKMEENDLSSEILNATDDRLTAKPAKPIEDDDEEISANEQLLAQDGPVELDIDSKTSSSDINFDVNIYHQSNAVLIRCTAGLDSRLYILSVGKSSTDDERIEVNDLSEELQQRLYDYLEELSVTDLVACFIRQYNLSYRNNKNAQSLKSILNFFSK